MAIIINSLKQNVSVGAIAPITFEDSINLPFLGFSSLGTLIYSNIVFGNPTNIYTDIYNNIYTFEQIIIYNVLMNVTQTKYIVKENTQGADGTVKDYISLGDYQIDISIFLSSFDQNNGVNANGVYPKNAVDNIIKMLKYPSAIPVTSWYLNQFGINNIVIDNFNFPQVPGGISQQQVNIQAISETQNSFITIQ